MNDIEALIYYDDEYFWVRLKRADDGKLVWAPLTYLKERVPKDIFKEPPFRAKAKMLCN